MLLKISLLGLPTVYWGEKLLSIERRAIRTLLYYLASHGKPIGRSHISMLFWPEVDQKKAHSNLRTLLAKLRASLPDPTLLITQENLVSLDFSRVEVDQVLFETSYKNLKNKPWHYPDDIPLPSQIVDIMQNALHCWSGMHFLEETNIVSTPALDEWLFFTDSRLIAFRQRLCSRLASHYSTIGEPGIAIRWLNDVLGYDRMNLDLQVQIIQLLLQAGRAGDAKRIFDYLYENYEEKTGKYLPDKILKYKNIIDNQEKLSNDHEAPPWPYESGMRTFLVGCDQQLESLQKAFQRGGIALVRGEEGAGKTRLLQELYKRVWRNTRLLVLKSQMHDLLSTPSDLVNMLRSQITDEDWSLLPNIWINILSLLMPELSTSRSNVIVPERLQGNQGQRLIVEAVYNLFQTCAREKKLLLIVDDFQWADETTLSIIHFLISKEFFNKHGLLVLSYRSNEEPGSISKLLKNPNKKSHLEVIDLVPLSTDEVGLLANMLLPGSPTHEFINQLSLITGGNPLFVIEAIKAFLDSDVDSLDDETFKNVTPSERFVSVVKQGMVSLSQNEINCLKAITILGSRIKPNLVKTMLNLPDSEISQALNVLTKKGFIFPLKGEDPTQFTYTFRHDAVLQIIFDTLMPLEARELHIEAARAIEEINPNLSHQQLVEVARHKEMGGLINEAIEKWLLVASRNWSMYARQETQETFEHIHAIIRKHKEEIETDLLVEVYYQQGVFAYGCADAEQMEILGNECLAIGKTIDYPILIGTGLFLLSGAMHLKEDRREALLFIERAISYLASDTSNHILKMAFIRKGMLLTLLERYREAMQTYLYVFEHEEEVSDLDDMRLLFESHFHLSMLHFRTGNSKESEKEISLAYEKYKYILTPHNHAQAHLSLSYNYSTQGRYLDSLKEAQAGKELVDAMQNPLLSEFFLYIISRNEVRLGYLDQAFRHAKQLIDSAEKNNHPEMRMRGYGVIGFAYYHLEDHARVIETMSIATCKYLISEIYQECLCVKANALTRTGKIDESEAVLKPVLDHTFQTEMKGAYYWASLVHAGNLMLKGALAQSEQLSRTVEQQAKTFGLYEIWTAAQQNLFYLYLLSRQHDKLDSLIDSILDWGQKSGSPWMLIKAPILSLAYTQESEGVKNQRLLESKRLIATLETNAQNEELRSSFEKARATWLKGF